MDKIISIDIIIPCYNVELHIEKCIMSLISQSYSKTSYYCYFINDASTDKTAEILNKYKNEQNITIIHHKQNKGLSAARNSGIKKSTSISIFSQHPHINLQARTRSARFLFQRSPV